MQLKGYVLSAFMLAGTMGLSGQTQAIDSSYQNSYYQGRMEVFESLPKTSGAVLFLGNSITERGQWHELLQEYPIMNRGIGGDNTFGVLARLDDLLAQKPAKAFILIGINDIGRGLPNEVIAGNYRKMLERFQKQSPHTRVYVQSVLPMNEQKLSADYLLNKKEIIIQLNEQLRALAGEFDVEYVDLYHELFSDGEGNLLPEYTNDGIHLTPVAYVHWTQYLKRQGHL